MAKPKQILSVREKLLLLAMYEDGKTDAQVAKVLGMPRCTLQKICKYNGITDTIKKAKMPANERVEKSLYIRATGFEYEEVKTEEVELIKKKNGIMIKAPATRTTTTRKFMPPDTGAACMWLKNRGDGSGVKWRDRIDHELSGNNPIPIEHILGGLSIEELTAIKNIIASKKDDN